MIDRISRDKLAEEIRHFIGCFKDNFEYDNSVFKISTKDNGVIKIRDSIWCIYDDLHRHKMEGKWALSAEQDKVIKRCIVFLKTNFEYRWPKLPIYYRIVRPLFWLISFGALTTYLDKYFSGKGNAGVWPFFSEEEYGSAISEPVYCAKRTL